MERIQAYARNINWKVFSLRSYLCEIIPQAQVSQQKKSTTVFWIDRGEGHLQVFTAQS